MPPLQSKEPLAPLTRWAGPDSVFLGQQESPVQIQESHSAHVPSFLHPGDTLVHNAGSGFLALQGFFFSLPDLETARTLPACPLLSESGTAITHCNPSPDRAAVLGAAPGRRESQSDWLRAHRELPGRAAFLTWEAQGDLCSQLPPKQVRARALHCPSLWLNYFHSCPYTLPIRAGMEMPITVYTFQRHCPV